MARLATEVDGVVVPRSDGWHVALLRRMAKPFPGVSREDGNPLFGDVALHPQPPVLAPRLRYHGRPVGRGNRQWL